MIRIKKAVLHILDRDAGMPVISKEPLELRVEMNEYLCNHLEKFMNSGSIKEGHFIEVAEEFLNVNEENFIETSARLAECFYSFMEEEANVPDSDLIYVYFEFMGKMHMAMLKYNYKSAYVHDVEYDGAIIRNRLVKQIRIIANEKQSADEGYIINLDEMNVNLIEKKIEINGKKENYISNHILKVTAELSLKDQHRIIEDTCNKIIQKQVQDPVSGYFKVADAVRKSMDEEDKIIDVQRFVEEVELMPDLTEELRQTLEAKGIKNEVKVNAAIEKRVSKSRKIITEEGIEITIPEHCNIEEMLDFNTNVDGTTNITIKGIGEYRAR
jgi:hypothetical protein